jgi:TolA-binding protein
MRYWIHIGAVVFCVALAACSGDKAKELLETAEFEERQQNAAHAKQLYEELVRLYPSSPQAEFARTRLEKLNKAQ